MSLIDDEYALLDLGSGSDFINVYEIGMLDNKSPSSSTERIFIHSNYSSVNNIGDSNNTNYIGFPGIEIEDIADCNHNNMDHRTQITENIPTISSTTKPNQKKNINKKIADSEIYSKNALKNLGKEVHKYMMEDVDLCSYFPNRSMITEKKFQSRKGLLDYLEGNENTGIPFESDSERKSFLIKFKKSLQRFICNDSISYLCHSKIKGGLNFYLKVMAKLLRSTYEPNELKLLKE